MSRLTFSSFAAALLTAPAAAHDGEVHVPGWTFDPALVIPLAGLLLLYVVGAARLTQRAKSQRRGVFLFVSGWAVLTLALLSPLHEGGEVSFTLHMIEHELIMLVATLLLAASGAGGALVWGLPRPVRLSLAGEWKAPFAAAWRRLTEPVTATILQAAAMWAWHVPALFDRALESRGWHIAQHSSFILTSLLFWWAMLHPRGGRSGYGVSAACLFVTSLVGGALGALMAFSQSPWYAGYASMQLSGIGLDPVADQQLAGLLMWVPGGIVHAAAALIILYRWLKAAETSHAYSLR
jgi:cytochrome c oxidase assembly factor CtaG